MNIPKSPLGLESSMEASSCLTGIGCRNAILVRGAFSLVMEVAVSRGDARICHDDDVDDDDKDERAVR
jgi:hypothetical protein